MLEYIKGDIFEDQSEALVNTVNCVGVMGRGVALQFKERFPNNYKAYKKICDAGGMAPGHIFVYDTGSMIGPRWILNFPTKRHWRGASRIEDIESGLDDLVKVIGKLQIKSVSMPPLGCGLGGLDWNEVRRRIVDRLSILQSVEFKVHEPTYAVDARPVNNVAVYQMKRGGAALALLARGYLRSALDPVLTLLKVHKLMYFLQVMGEELKLNYVKAPYGPYAENLKFVLQKTEGHILSGYQENGQKPYMRLDIVPNACEDAERFLLDYPETAERIRKVTDLTDGFESDAGLELLASVHWVCANEGANSAEQAYNLVHSWNTHKRDLFTKNQVNAAYVRLEQYRELMPVQSVS